MFPFCFHIEKSRHERLFSQLKKPYIHKHFLPEKELSALIQNVSLAKKKINLAWHDKEIMCFLISPTFQVQYFVFRMDVAFRNRARAARVLLLCLYPWWNEQTKNISACWQASGGLWITQLKSRRREMSAITLKTFRYQTLPCRSPLWLNAAFLHQHQLWK